ncbi:MRN complex-interacting protein isoform X1 [Pyrgilauda ruficollis]|uniref:MRN complex-interacting protein isoform X1 n=1 Tax=Pyrgilauda ruficollis TaxID=221976 RepID=UPI001B85C94A|nr:MRN complex-interacting protein isoform X1 [Pyrgilauda ruficollis]
MAQQFWVLRCCCCRRFQGQQAKRSRRWSCSVCGQRQAVQKVYGQGSGLECRRHVQKLNLLQGEAEEALGWTSRCVEDSVNDSKNREAQHEDSSVQQEGRTEGSRWSKYLEQESEDQEDEEEAALERQQFCSQRKNTVGEQRKHPKRFLSSAVPEHAEESGASQLVCQAKKVKTTECKKCFVAVPDGRDGDAGSGGSVVPAVRETLVPEENTQPPPACTKPSKWGKFLSLRGSSSENAAAVTMALQEGSGGVGLDSTAAGGAWRCSEQAGRTLPQDTGFEFKKCVASTEDLASTLPSSRCPVEDVLREPHKQVLRVGSAAGRCCLDATGRANTLVNSYPRPKLSNICHEQLFCTGPVDCYGSVSSEGPSFLQHAQHCQHHLYKDHEIT